MGKQVRRVVTGHEADGKAVALYDGTPSTVRARGESGTKSWVLWVSDSTPADVSGGSIFRIVEFYPIDHTKLPLDYMSRAIGADHTPAKGRPPRHPAMHRTRSIDYAVVMSGEIDMLLDDSEVHLRAGDVVVQQSTNHAWINRGAEPCRIAFVLIDAKES
jgi:mannose-6-phosphate isomerase-like protein (cupin superfamily)